MLKYFSQLAKAAQWLIVAVAVWLIIVGIAPSFAQPDPLSSWNDRPAKQAIIKFVKTVTDKSSQNYVKPDDRIATFDQDGTLWVEHPLYTHAVFALDRVKTLPRSILNGRPKSRLKRSLRTIKR